MTNDIIADIVREMRTIGRLDEKSTDKIPRSLQALGLRTYADRIEAAANRECEATSEKSSQVGNAAKMREALSRILGIADHLQTRFAIPKLASEEILELKQIAESALAAPPRNCDVLSKDEVLKVLDDRSFSKEDTIEWLYEEAKGEAK